MYTKDKNVKDIINELLDTVYVFKMRLGEDFDFTNIEIRYYVEDELVRKIDQEYFYQSNPGSVYSNNELDMVKLVMKDINFIFVKKSLKEEV